MARTYKQIKDKDRLPKTRADGLLNLCYEINQIGIHDFYVTLTDIVYPAKPFRLFGSFELLGYAPALCHLFYTEKNIAYACLSAAG